MESNNNFNQFNNDNDQDFAQNVQNQVMSGNSGNPDLAQEEVQAIEEVQQNNQGDFQERQGTEQNQPPHASMAPRNMQQVQAPISAAQID